MAGADRVQLRVGTSSDATTAGDTLLADTNGAELAITDDRTAGVGNVRGWLADGNSHASQVTSQPRGIWATPGDLAADIAAAVTGLLDFKGATNCSGNPNYPAASKGDTYVVSTAGKIGGASGKSVDIGDMYLATADNAGGTEASVGTSWSVLEHNLVGALLASNNLSDLASKATALANLSGQAGADFAWNTNKLTGVKDPTAAQDVATKAYTDASQVGTPPSLHGMKAWVYAPEIGTGNTIVVAGGTLHLVRIYTPAAITITTIWSMVQAGGASLTNTGWCLYDTAGVLLQSTVASSGANLTQYQSTGTKSITVTSQAFAAGASFYVGFWFNGTTLPTFYRSGNTGFALNPNLSAGSYRHCTSSTGLTTTPPNPFATQVLTNATGWWVGVS